MAADADAATPPRSGLRTIGRVVLICLALLVALILLAFLVNLVWLILDPSHRM